MPTYYVLSNDGNQELPTISQHNELQSALRQYREWLSEGCRAPLLLRQLEVQLTVIDDDVPGGASLPLGSEQMPLG